MHNIVMIIPSAIGTAPGFAENVYAYVFPSLVSCLPALLHMEQEDLQPEGQERLLRSCSLWFPSEEEAQFALSSMEWVELIDETADVFDWETVEFRSAYEGSPRTEFVAS